MEALLQFSGVVCVEGMRTHTFALYEGAVRQLQLASEEEKEAMIDVLIGRRKCFGGKVTLQGIPLPEHDPGSIGWVAADGGLISNLKIWENVTLPLWYHSRCGEEETEQRIRRWLTVLDLPEEEWKRFMEVSPHWLAPEQRKLAGLLRALVQTPPVLVVDATLFKDVDTQQARTWTAALEVFAAQERAVLAVSDEVTVLPWERLEVSTG